MAAVQDGRYAVTDGRRQALGPEAVPARSVDLERIRASTANDVRERSATNNRSSAMLERSGQIGAQPIQPAHRVRPNDGLRVRYLTDAGDGEKTASGRS